MNATRHPIKSLESEARTLLEIERAGERPESLFIATASVMGVVFPIGAVMMILAFGAAWLFG
jgi:hypothetical protein